MNDNPYVERLARFKQNEKPEAVLLLADKPDLVKIVVAWMNLDVKCTDKFTEIRDKSEEESWKWLWENTDYSLSELKEKVGMSFAESALGNKMKPLILNRVIYPDGTINSFVQRYLREQVLKLLEVKPKRTARKS